MIDLSSPQQVARMLAVLGVYSPDQIVETLKEEHELDDATARTIVDEATEQAAEVHREEQRISRADLRALAEEHDINPTEPRRFI